MKLSALLMAVCGLGYAETAPAGNPSADAALKAYAEQQGLHNQGREAAANYFYEQGQKAMQANRVDDAVKAFTVAVDYMPEKPEYRAALTQAQAISGQSRDARSVYVNQMADQLQVQQQRLWVEAQGKIDEGKKYLAAGDFAEAERSFQLAHIRIESLPFADERKEPELREVESLVGETRQRRAHQELQDATERNQSAEERQRHLRDLSLKIERDRIDAMLNRAMKARERRNYDEAILLLEQILKINRAEERAHDLLVRCRRERHVWMRQVTADRWDEEHRLLSEQIRTAMLPQLELLVYSHDWPQIDARRTAPVRGLTEESEDWRKEIKAQLEQEVTLDFQDHDLADVVNFLQKITNVNIVLDPAVVAAGPPPVTLKVEAMKLRFVLDFIMKLTNLTYVLRDEAIFISNTAGTRGDIYMKLYDIRDLTHGLTSFPGPEIDIPEPGGTGSRLLPPIEDTKPPELNEFIEIIKKVVSPKDWEAEGVAIEEYQGSMVITQTGDIHRQVEELLRNLRNQRGTQIHVKVKFLNVENSLLEEIGVDWRNFNAAGIVPPNTPNPPQAPAAGGLGAYNQSNQYTVAAVLNNQLQDYATAHSLLRPTATEGLTFQSQTFHLADGLFASAVLQAVEKERRGNIIFEPDITLFNGQQAHLVHMNQQSYVADYDVVQAQYDPIISVLSYGTVLDVHAVASADKKYITLTLRPTNTSIREWRRFGPPPAANNPFPGGIVVAPPNNVAIAGGNPIFLPELNYQAVRTSVTIPDGGSLLLAGMTNGESSRSHAGIPFLSHIPFLGRLFSRNGRQETELRTIIIVSADLIIFDEIEKGL